MLTHGQYLQPTPQHLPVAEFVHPDTFKELEEIDCKKDSCMGEWAACEVVISCRKACDIKRVCRIFILTFYT